MTTRTEKAKAPPPLGVIRSDEVYLLAEVRRRLGWQEHAVRQARKAGLRVRRFGRQDFILGHDLLVFFSELPVAGEERGQ